jgi:hypothetical protein
MAVYRFRISFEDHDDVYREIDILGKQSYEDLHRAIQEAIGFDHSKDASFFMSDDYWRKGLEIASSIEEEDDDDDDYPRRKKTQPKLMSKSRIADFIDDPHQRLVYIFDPVAKWTLLVELMKIVADDPKANYPRCSKTVGAAPKQYKQKLAPPPEDDEEEDDEEDKKSKERAFTAEEEFDKSEPLDGEEEGEDVPSTDGEDTEEPGEESDEAEGSDFDPSEFGGGEEDY